MPEIDGLELIRRIRAKSDSVHVVIISGYSDFNYARRAMQFRVADYLLKPVGVQEIEEVLMRVTETIGGSKHTRIPVSPQIDVDLLPTVNRILEAVTRKSWEEIGEILLGLFGQISDEGGDIEHFRVHAIRLISLLVEREIIFANESTLMRAGQIGSASSRSQVYDVVKEQILLTQNRSVPSPSMNPHVQKILVHVLAHYRDKNLTLRRLSEQVVFMNPDYLGKLFQQEIGRSFANHLAAFRIARACEVLKSGTPIAIADLARRVGYGDNVSYFIRQFKKLRGTTPSAFAAQTVVSSPASTEGTQWNVSG